MRDLQALRGIAEISAVTIASELGRISRFENPRQLMGYSGTVPGRTPVASGPGAGASPKRATRI